MTLKELYTMIGGDYDQALRVLRMEKLLDKHIRKLSKNGVIDHLLEAGKIMDPATVFEAAHAMKGVCANLGLTQLSNLASDIAEEFRPGNSRTLTDEEVARKLALIEDLKKKTMEGISQYEAE